MDRYNPFEKLSDLYDSIVDWENDPLIKPENQNKYLFSDGKTYYEQLCKILKLLSTFKDGFNQIYDNLDELEELIEQTGVTQEDLQNAITNLHTTISGEIATVESNLSGDISDLDTQVTSLSGRVTSVEGNISTLQTLTATHSTDIATINTAITSIQASLLTKISDAPQDGKTYGRKNGTWIEVTGGGGGGTSDYDALDNKPQINGNILTGNKTSAQLGLVDASALNSYVAKADAPGYDDILTKTNAQLIYQTIQAMANYLQKTDAPGYADILTKTDASTIYQTILAMNDYLLKNDAPGYADILTKTSAATLYQTILQSGVSIKTINNQNLLGSGNIATATQGQITTINSRLDDVDDEIVAINGNISGINNTLSSKMDTSVANASFMPINRIASASQLGGIKVGNGLSIDSNGVLSASGSAVYGAWQTVNITASTSTGNAPLYTAVDIQVKYDTAKKNLLFNGSFTAKGSGNTVETIITTDLIIPNNTGQEISIKNVVIRDNFKARLIIGTDGVVKFGVYGSVNNSDYGILPVPINIDNFV